MSTVPLVAPGQQDDPEEEDVAEQCMENVENEIKKGTTLEVEVQDKFKAVLGRQTDKLSTCTQRLFEAKMNKRVFLSGVVFARDCGYHDVQNLCDTSTPGGVSLGSRAFWAALTLVFAVYNCYFLLAADLHFPEISECTDERTRQQPFLIAVGALGAARRFFSPGSEPWHVECRGTLVVGYLELFGLAVLFARLLGHVSVIYSHSKDRNVEGQHIHGGPKLWQANADLCWTDLPLLSEYSGMKLLTFIQPWILAQDLNYIKYVMGGATHAYFSFLLTRIIAILIGFDVFLTKFRTTATCALASELSWHNFISTFIFMRQVLGIVQVDRLLKRRVFMFVFGGEENTMDLQEEAKMNAWKCRIVQEIWKDSIKKSHGFWRYMVIMLSFTDADIQKLILDTRRCRRLWSQNAKHARDERVQTC